MERLFTPCLLGDTVITDYTRMGVNCFVEYTYSIFRKGAMVLKKKMTKRVHNALHPMFCIMYIRQCVTTAERFIPCHVHTYVNLLIRIHYLEYAQYM